MEVQNWSKLDILEAISAPTQKLHLLFGPASGVIQIMNCQGMQKSATFFGRCFLTIFIKEIAKLASEEVSKFVDVHEYFIHFIYPFEI